MDLPLSSYGIRAAVCAALLPTVGNTAESQGAMSRNRSDTVIVEGARITDYKQETSSVTKLTELLRDTPQSITTVSRDEIDDRAVTSMNDALRSVPGISLGAGETSWQGTNLFLRGFTTRNDMFTDGMRDYGYYYRDPFDVAAIEVLKGPASMLFGRGSTGGVIQQVSKSAALEARAAGTLLLGTDRSRRATLDIGAPVSALGETAAVRLNAMAHHGEVERRDGSETDRWGVAPTLALGLGTPTRLHVSYLHQSDDIRPDYGLPWFAGRPAPVRRSNFYGFSSDYLNTDVDVATVRLEHDVTASVKISNQARYSRAQREFRISEAIVPAGTSATTPVEAITISRNVFEGYSTDEFMQNQTDVVARFSTGPLQHSAVMGIELGREEPTPVYIANVGVPTTNLANPQRQQYSVLQSYPRLAAKARADSIGVFALDTIEFGEGWQAMLGVRWDRFDSDYRSTGYSPSGVTIATTNVSHVDESPSFRTALLYKPVDSATVYLSYGDSFNPSAEGIESLVSSGRAVAQANLNLDPEESRTYELGAKWEWFRGGVLLSSAIFRTEKNNARVPDPLIPGFNSLGGEQRVDGFEIELVGRLAQAWNLRAGYSYLDSEVTRSAPGGPVVGAPLTVAPRNSVSIWSEYSLPFGMELGLGAVSVSSRLGQNTAAAYLVAPGYTTVDAMAKYSLAANLTLQLNVSNLTDKYYFDQLHPFHVVPGAGRTGLLSVQMRY